MSFLAPVRLWLLVLVAALAVGYMVLQRRRPTYALRFTELELLASVAPRGAAWRRHVPAALMLLTLAALTTAFARPEAEVDVPRERATVVIALDVSISMQADDVAPDRITAAKQAAETFVERLPERFNVGLVAFDGSARVIVPPTRDHASVTAALGGLRLGPSTAIGDAVHASLEAIATVPGEPGQPAPPARVVLLSDGTNTVGRSVPSAEQSAGEAEVPVSTIAYGTQTGTVTVQGRTIEVPVDRTTLAQLAEATGGAAFTAESGEELGAVYDDIGSQVGTTTERQEVTARFAGVALLLGLAAAVASLVWGARLP